MKLQWNYWLQTFLAVATKWKSEMTSYLNNGYDVMNHFAKFEKSYLIVWLHQVLWLLEVKCQS